VLCTTVGETASDFLNINLNFGLSGTSIVMGALLAVALLAQFRVRQYVPVVYWLNVVLISIFGTLVTDNLTDGIGFPLEYSTILFSALLLATFAVWYAQERTLSIHSIVTARRETFYWLAVLFTFALGTAAGDLMAEALGLGYAMTGVIIVVVVAIFAAAWRGGLNSILAFWVIYIMTRPLGASLGDLLTQSREHGGLGLGATATTAVFSAGIVLTVLFLAFTKRDVSTEASLAAERSEMQRHPHVFAQVVAVAILFAVASTGGYIWRQHQLAGGQQAAAAASDPAAPLGDLGSFHGITQAMLDSVKAGDWAGANTHANDIEYAWDQAEARLKPMNPDAWDHVDGAIDKVLREIRAVAPNQQTAEPALQELQEALAKP
jgi:uncharacterized membrane-anchored protein